MMLMMGGLMLFVGWSFPTVCASLLDDDQHRIGCAAVGDNGDPCKEGAKNRRR